WHGEGDLLRGESFETDAPAARVFDFSVDHGRVRWCAGRIDAARGNEGQRDASLRLELGHHLRGSLGEAGLDLAGLDQREETGRAGRDLRTRLVLIEEHDIAHARLGQVERGREAKGACADDDSVCGCRKRHSRMPCNALLNRYEPAVRPPSTGRVTPVIQEASSEQRKRAALATSSGRPTRPSGYQGRMWSMACGSRFRRSLQIGVWIVPGAMQL